jgi:uncharacterized protein (DUF433 family)
MDRISGAPQIHFGKPCIAGTRITVQSVLELLNEGLSFEAIIQDYYPDLQVEDIRACLRYAIAIVSSIVFLAEVFNVKSVPMPRNQVC